MGQFDKIIDRRNTGCAKWDGQGGDYIPLWVADMDFESPKPIIEALIERARHGVFGYNVPDSELVAVITDYYRNKYAFEINPDWLVWLPNVNVSANIACRTVKGDIMFNTPIYSHINMKLPAEARKNSVKVPLKIENNEYTFDFERMEQSITDDVRVFVLCNPHNPVGRVYREEELSQLAAFAKRHDLLVVSDEIHSDLVFEGTHIPLLTLNEDVRNRSITLHAASKTYNIPGIPFGFAIIPNKELKERFLEEAYGLFPGISSFAAAAYKAAFTKCEDWRIELLEYIKGNHAYLEKRVSEIKGFRMLHAEATYLAWIDAGETGLENPYQFFLDHAGIKFGDGAEFGGQQFIRVNLGCPRSVLETAFDKIEKALER